ncbi:MAG: cell wall-active antibiotics response protein [Bacteroidales bacterium]|jgi:predicted membrane protein|nr:cell wall-active antibiotics response protein [Bacteroidales bacterium]
MKKLSSLVFGLLIIAAGVLLFAFNTGYLPIEYKSVVFSMPSLVMLIGLVTLFSRRGWFWGVLLFVVGGAFLLPKLHIAGLNQVMIGNGWSIGLIVGGILILCKTLFGKRHYHCHADANFGDFHEKMKNHKEWHQHTRRRWEQKQQRKSEAGFIERNFVFGGASEKINFQDFKGGDINCVFGGVELDLSDAKLAEGVHTLEINTVFGGVSLFIPVEWNIEIQQSQVFGRFVDNRPKPGFEVNEHSRLILEVTSVFGGGEIQCKKIDN